MRPAWGEAPMRQEAEGALPCPGEVPSGVQLAATLSRCCSCTACRATSSPRSFVSTHKHLSCADLVLFQTPNLRHRTDQGHRWLRLSGNTLEK